MNQVTQKGTLEIAEHEGVVLGPYFDSVRVLTYGVGHTAAAGGLDPRAMPRVDTRGWSQAQVDAELLRALAVFDDDLGKYEARVTKAIGRTVKPHEFDALVSWDFNTGGATHRSASGKPAQLIQQVRAGNMSGGGFMGWLRPPEIRKRREAEMKLFQTGNYDANGDRIPVYDALPDGRIRHRMTISGAQLAALMKKNGAKHVPVASIKPSVGGIIAAIFARLFGRTVK